MNRDVFAPRSSEHPTVVVIDRGDDGDVVGVEECLVLTFPVLADIQRPQVYTHRSFGSRNLRNIDI